MRYFGTAVTDAGIRKRTNQDSVCLKVADTKRNGQVAMCALCDGMGGWSKGELASATVIRSFARWFDEQLPCRLQDAYTWHKLSDEWKQMIQEENSKLMEYGKQIQANIGTTFSALLIIEEKYMIAHVGDCRIYRLDDMLEQLTEDQTEAQRKVQEGNLTQAEAKWDPGQHLLLQCVGGSTGVEPTIRFGNVRPDSAFLLCSDGFRHVLEEEEIYCMFQPDVLTDIDTMNRKSRQMIDTVKNRNETDNISVALIKCTN